MERSPRQVGLSAVTVLTMAIALTVVTGPAAVADTPVSCAEDIPAYLVGIGVDPDDAANAICQEGLRNYAGPRCPGENWTCARADRPVVQIADQGGTNLFHCTARDCLVVQSVESGQNASACERSEDVDGEAVALQECWIVQENTTGANAAGIAQHIQQTRTSAQNARQVARIEQDNATGSNIARIVQGIGQSSRVKGGQGPITQSQDAHQAATVDQFTLALDAVAGDNISNIRQTQAQSQRASRPGDPITQSQNPGTGLDPACDQPMDTTYDQAKNQCVFVTQNSTPLPGAGGSNRSTMNQLIEERQVVEKASAANQTQGSPDGGQSGDKVQNSSAPSESHADQDMLQAQTTSGVPAGSVNQAKHTGDPRCCQIQQDNENNTSEITQNTDQFASSTNAIQDASLVGNCSSSGTCHIVQSATVNGVTEPNECTDSDPPGACLATIVCAFGGESANECESASFSGGDLT
jgi:hypothetical protein